MRHGACNMHNVFPLICVCEHIYLYFISTPTPTLVLFFFLLLFASITDLVLHFLFISVGGWEVETAG